MAIAYRLVPVDQSGTPRWNSQITATSESPIGVGERLPVGDETWLVVQVDDSGTGHGTGLLNVQAADGKDIPLGGTLLCRRNG